MGNRIPFLPEYDKTRLRTINQARLFATRDNEVRIGQKYARKMGLGHRGTSGRKREENGSPTAGDVLKKPESRCIRYPRNEFKLKKIMRKVTDVTKRLQQR